MNDIFASIYEFGMTYSQTYSMDLFNNGAYMSIFLSMLFPATALMAIFYFLVKYPFCKWFHWLIVLGAALLTTGVLTYNILAENLAVYLLDTANFPDINTFVSTFIMYNLILSSLTGFVFTLIFKQAPLPQRNVPFGGK
jgi:hypothetical protein